MNSIILTGNIVRDVKLEKTKNNKPYLKNVIAVVDGYKTEYEKTYFINFETYNVDTIKSFKDLKKGNLIELQGKLVVESFKGKDGNWVNITKVVVFKVEKLDFSKKKQPEDEPFGWGSFK